MDRLLERLEQLGQQKLADDVRHSMPSVAKAHLRGALRQNEDDLQAFLLKEQYRHHKFEDMRQALQSALDRLNGTPR